MSEKTTYKCELCGTKCVDSESIYYFGEFRLCSKCYNTPKEELDKRIFDCVIACRFLPTSALEAGVVEKMVEEYHRMCDACFEADGKCRSEFSCKVGQIIKLLEVK